MLSLLTSESEIHMHFAFADVEKCDTLHFDTSGLDIIFGILVSKKVAVLWLSSPFLAKKGPKLPKTGNWKE